MTVYTLHYSTRSRRNGAWVSVMRVFSTEAARDAVFNELEHEIGYIDVWGDVAEVE